MEHVPLVVVGAGAAGIAAARAARIDGVPTVVLVSAAGGATEASAGWIVARDASRVSVELGWLAGVGLRSPGTYRFASTSGVTVDAVSGHATLLDLHSLAVTDTIGVADVDTGPGWSSAIVARSLSAIVPNAVRVVAPATPLALGNRYAIAAQAMDTPGRVDGLCESFRSSVAGCAALLFPPVLGLRNDDVAARCSKKLGVAVGTCGADAGDAVGTWVVAALGRSLDERVQRITGTARITGGQGGRGYVRVGHQEWSADAVVLATGGLAGGGIVFDGAFVEPCAHADVWLDEREDTGGHSLPLRAAERGLDPTPLFEPDADGAIRAMGVGVRVLDDHRVATRDGRAALHSWLFACGAVVRGGSGVYGGGIADALIAGADAGRAAARHAQTLRTDGG